MIAIETVLMKIRKAVAVSWTLEKSVASPDAVEMALTGVREAMADYWTLQKSAALLDAVDCPDSVQIVA